ncbi:WXG100 family type VII secretion target [Actinokineospora xionganensis]|uniref:ESAT-6-like protein n=1 Tax=Actinokineospora xionganensis TaxID=2684470 RepID=A0ABR7L0V8_9PSEU|nr:WXG100 family type VII secretion target [Actinokineospora xionganensis]MBC6446321.1 WXG100 family type VII secretion target [Actinokineospora xionganensis]
MPNDMIKVNFAEVANASQALSSSAGKLETLLGELKQRLAPLEAGYEGAAKEAWHAKQQEWNRAQDDLRQVLASIGMAVQQSGDNYEATEKANAAKWG